MKGFIESRYAKWKQSEVAQSLRGSGGTVGGAERQSSLRYIVLEHHPQDCRVKIAKDGICQALSQKMGTGGGNVPLVIEVDDGEQEGTLDPER